MPRRLIAVEGLPGSGKSTFAQALAYGMARAETAHDVRWFSELEVGHPLALSYAPEQYPSIDAYAAECRAAWSAFVRSVDSTVIVDAWLLQDPVFGLLVADVSPEEILRVMGELFTELPALEVEFVVLVQRDVARAVERFCQARGERMRTFYVDRNDRSAFARSRGALGMSGLVRFWSEHSEICQSVLARSAVRRIDIDVSEQDWRRATAELFGALGFEVSAQSAGESLEQFAGRYALDDTARSFEIVVESGTLVLRNFPFFWREVDSVLVREAHLPAHVFAVQSWPAQVEFDVRDGMARSLTVREIHRFGSPPWPGGTYPRV